MRVLILGGTSEATALARALADDPRFQATLSLAGRTRAPVPPPIPWRIGGFGGVDGLIAYLRAERIDALVDATHPFAEQITRHAEAAAGPTGVPLLVICRPPWQPSPGDHWTIVPDMPAAAKALGRTPRRVFLTIGQKDLSTFAAAPWHHYLIRSIDPPNPAALPTQAEVIAARGPFQEAAERQLLAQHRIDIIVTKNSGGTATAGKLVAARALGLPVVMVARPAPPAIATVAEAPAAMDWLVQLHGAPTAPRRGV
jgi:precorrin-6A/cobalt-precorrin-6A reductase